MVHILNSIIGLFIRIFNLYMHVCLFSCDSELKRGGGGGGCDLTLMSLLLSVSPHPDYGGTCITFDC